MIWDKLIKNAHMVTASGDSHGDIYIKDGRIAVSYTHLILHEFSTIPGVKEDVTEIILNLKKLAVRLEGENTKRAIILSLIHIYRLQQLRKYGICYDRSSQGHDDRRKGCQTQRKDP